MAASPSIQPNPIQAFFRPPCLPLGAESPSDPLVTACPPPKLLVCLSQVLLTCTLFTCCSGCNPAGLLWGQKEVCGHKEGRHEEQRAGISGWGGLIQHRSRQRFMQVIKPLRYIFFNACVGLMMHFSLLWTGWVCSAVEGDGGLAVVCVVIGTEEVVPTEAWADIIKNTQQGTWGLMRERVGAQRWANRWGGSRWVGRGRFRLKRHWPKTARGTHLWAPEAKEIGCDLKITPVGEDGEARGVGGVRLHVNQALYKFSVCLLKELNRQTPATRRELLEKNKLCSGGRKEESWRASNWLGLFRGFGSTAASTWKGRLFFSLCLPNRHSRGRPSFSGSRKEEDWPTGRQEPLIQWCLLSWVSGSVTAPGKDRGKFTNVIPSLSSFSIIKGSSCRHNLLLSDARVKSLRTPAHRLRSGNVRLDKLGHCAKPSAIMRLYRRVEVVSMGSANNVYRIPAPFNARERRGNNRSQRSFLNWIDQLGQVKANCQTCQRIWRRRLTPSFRALNALSKETSTVWNSFTNYQ